MLVKMNEPTELFFLQKHWQLSYIGPDNSLFWKACLMYCRMFSSSMLSSSSLSNKR